MIDQKGTSENLMLNIGSHDTMKIFKYEEELKWNIWTSMQE